MSARQPDAALTAAVCAALRAQVEKIGLSIGDEPSPDGLSFAEQVDPFSQETSLIGTWKGGWRYGTVTYFPDGRVFAEYQVLLPQPGRPDRYVEAVQVWGRLPRLGGDAVIVEGVS